MLRSASVLVLVGLTALPACGQPGLRELKKTLKTGDTEEVTALLERLRGKLDAKCVKAILAGARRIQPLGVYDETVATLGTAHGDALEELAKAFDRQKNPVLRFLVLDALAHTTDPIGEDTLVKAVCEERDEQVAVFAVRLLKKRGTLTSVDRLIELLEVTQDRRGRHNLVRAINSALSDATGMDHRRAAEWAHWWQAARGGFAKADDAKQAKPGQTRTRTVLDRMRSRRPGDLRTIERVKKGDIVVVKGDYDQVEEVLTSLELPHEVRDRADFDQVTLIPERQVLVLNCAADPLSPKGVQKVRGFVERGGYVFSSDWALSNTLAKAFPEVLGTPSRTGPDETHAIRSPAASAAHPLLRDLFELNPWEAAKRTFKWQVDASSDLVSPKPNLVVLVEALDLKAKTGTGIVACTFAFTAVGGGTVVPEEVASRPLTGRPLKSGGTRQRRARNGRERPLRIGRVLHVLSHFQHQKNESGDGFALQQLLLNFVVEKQEAIMAHDMDAKAHN